MDICHLIDPDCRACGRPVYWKKRVFYLDKLWHLDCFRCAGCKVRLNTECEKNDTKYSKGILGEDKALRCNRCNEIFEDKKRAKTPYIKKSGILNHLFEGELTKEKQQIDNTNKRTHKLNAHPFDKSEFDCHYPYHKNFNIESRKDLQKFETHHKCHCVGHKCIRDRKCRVSDQNLNVKRCLHNDQKYSNERGNLFATEKLELLDTKKTGAFENKMTKLDLKERTSKVANSSEVHRSMVKDKKINLQSNVKRCNCTGCKEYLNA